MKNTLLFPVVLSAAMLVSTPVFADDLWEPETELDRIPAVHTMDRPAFVGTSLADTRMRHHIVTPNKAFPNSDVDETGYIVGTADPEKGNTDDYGSVLYDVGTLR